MLRVVARDGGVAVVEVEAPRLRRGEVLVETRYSVISPGTERAIVAATGRGLEHVHEYPEHGQAWPRIRSDAVRGEELLPRPPSGSFASLGYGLAGVVLDVAPDVTDLRPGDEVACAGSQCAFHAEIVAVPRSLAVPVPAGLPLDRAAFVTLGSIAMASLRRAGCGLGETVVVLGAGVLGNLTVQLAAAAGMYSACVDPRAARRALVAAHGGHGTHGTRGGHGTHAAPAVDDPELAAWLARSTGGFGADAAIVSVTTRSGDVVDAALGLLRRGGRVVLVGQMELHLDRDRLFGSGATIATSSAYGPGRYDPVYEESNVDFPIDIVRWTENRNMALVLRLAAEERLDLAAIPVVRAPIGEAPGAYAALAADESVLTAILSYGESR